MKEKERLNQQKIRDEKKEKAKNDVLSFPIMSTIYLNKKNMVWFRFVVFNATFNNISVISWRSVLLVEEIGVPGEKPVTDKLYHIMLYRLYLSMSWIQTHNFKSKRLIDCTLSLTEKNTNVSLTLL
jgi:hypothetical protein